MAHLDGVSWPPDPIPTDRLILREAERPGHVRAEGGEAELGYMLLPDAWGRGYATEACAAAVGWFRAVAPGEPLVVSTQVANTASRRVLEKLGFQERERHEEWGEPQWFGVWSPASR